jgi:hypothetical protein
MKEGRRIVPLAPECKRLEPRVMVQRPSERTSAFKRRADSYEAKVFFNARVDIKAMDVAGRLRVKVYNAVKRKADWSMYNELVKRRMGDDRRRIVEIRSGPEIVT